MTKNELIKEIEEKIENENWLGKFKKACYQAKDNSYDCMVVLEVVINQDLELLKIEVYERLTNCLYNYYSPYYHLVLYSYEHKALVGDDLWGYCIDEWKNENIKVKDIGLSFEEMEELLRNSEENIEEDFYNRDEVREIYEREFDESFDISSYENTFFYVQISELFK